MTLDGGVPGIFIPLFLIVRELVLKVCGSPVSKRPWFPSGYVVYSSLVLFQGVAVLEQLITYSACYRTTIAISLVSKVAPELG